jgi:hypothetical protein
MGGLCKYYGSFSLRPFSSRRDPAPQESDIQVDMPNRGNTQRISAK